MFIFVFPSKIPHMSLHIFIHKYIKLAKHTFLLFLNFEPFLKHSLYFHAYLLLLCTTITIFSNQSYICAKYSILFYMISINQQSYITSHIHAFLCDPKSVILLSIVPYHTFQILLIVTSQIFSVRILPNISTNTLKLIPLQLLHILLLFSLCIREQ